MKLAHHHPPRNGLLPLFAWADARERRARLLPLAARLVAVRYALPLDRAALIAELAGLGDGGRP
jgi:hypothetical protein